MSLLRAPGVVGAIRAAAPRSVWFGSGMWRPEPGRAMMPRFGSGACMRSAAAAPVARTLQAARGRCPEHKSF
eukprot:5183132-Prymnesium_polylepis.1